MFVPQLSYRRGELLRVDFMPSTLAPWVKLIYEVYTKKTLCFLSLPLDFICQGLEVRIKNWGILIPWEIINFRIKYAVMRTDWTDRNEGDKIDSWWWWNEECDMKGSVFRYLLTHQTFNSSNVSNVFICIEGWIEQNISPLYKSWNLWKIIFKYIGHCKLDHCCISEMSTYLVTILPSI